MKMILQKHTSKFVAGLFNSLGITACVSLTSCGGENKSKQTENQGEDLKNGLIGQGLGEDEVKAIADWLNNKNYGSDYKLNAKDLQEIFKNDPNKLNEVAEKLGVILTESDDEPDDEKKKEINEWLNKLNGLENAKFNELGGDLKEKVAQKFIENEININEVTVIKEKLAGFIEDVKDEKKQNEISIKVVCEGKVAVTNVFDRKKTEFDFTNINGFKGFVDALKGKYITQVEGELSFAFTMKNVKICGYKDGFDYSADVVDFFKCFESLINIKALKLQVSGLSLKIEKSALSLNEIDCSSEDYFKKVGFWTLVKDHAAFFGITEKNKFEIVKNGNDENATVKINDFAISLRWNDVVGGENTFKEDAGWNKIFMLKSKAAGEVEGNVIVKFEEGKCCINAGLTGVELNSLEALGELVGDLKGKIVKIDENKKFSLAFSGKNVKVCGHTTGFNVMQETDFAILLGYVKSLKNVKAIGVDFKIALTMEKQKVLFDGGKIDDTFVKTAEFWNTVKDNIDLFGISEGKIKVEQNDSDDQCKINESLVVTDLKFSVVCGGSESVVKGYDQIFSLSATKLG